MKYIKPEISVLEAQYTDVIMTSGESLTNKVGKKGAEKTAAHLGDVNGIDIFAE